MKDLIAHVQREPSPDETRERILLTRQQLLARIQFAEMANVAWEEELAQKPLSQRTAQQLLLLGHRRDG